MGTCDYICGWYGGSHHTIVCSSAGIAHKHTPEIRVLVAVVVGCTCTCLWCLVAVLARALALRCLFILCYP
jgi:hypothetical protein